MSKSITTAMYPLASCNATFAEHRDSYVDRFAIVRDAYVRGHYAYWLTTIFSSMLSALGTRTEIDRLDLSSPGSPPTAFVPSRLISDFAVGPDALYYAAGLADTPSGGVYRVTDPTWRATDVQVPVR